MKGPYIAIDFETSAYSGASACAVGMARLENLEITATFYSLIRPASPRVFFTEVHGLTWQDLKNEPSFAELWPRMSAFFANALFFVAHNAPFDRRVLASCCAATGLPMPQIPFLCTLKGARRKLRLPGNGLASVAAFLDIPLNHHNAISDAEACGLIHSRLRQMGLPDAAMLI